MVALCTLQVGERGGGRSSGLTGMVERVRKQRSPDLRRPLPGPLDYLDLLLLRAAKLRRTKYNDPDDFYETFFTDGDVAKYLRDIRTIWRYGLMRRVYDELFGPRPARVADIGCGFGISRLFLPETTSFVGVEISAKTLEFARTVHNSKTADFQQGGFPRLPLEEDSYDFVLCLEVLEHLRDDKQAIGELNRIVKPGCFLFFSVPSTFFWSDYTRLIGHHRHYTAASVERLLREGGFEVTRQFSRFGQVWRGYYYAYLLFRVGEMLRRKLGDSDYTMYDSRLYGALAKHMRRYLYGANRDDDATSTFVLAQKVATSAR